MDDLKGRNYIVKDYKGEFMLVHARDVLSEDGKNSVLLGGGQGGQALHRELLLDGRPVRQGESCGQAAQEEDAPESA